MLGVLGLDAVLWMGLHKDRTEGDNPLPLPAGHVSSHVAQDAVDHCSLTEENSAMKSWKIPIKP